MSQNFAFTKLVVGDLDRCAAFYETVFGLKVQARIDAEILGRAITEIVYEPTATGAGAFILLAYHDAPRPAAGEVIVGFSSREVDALIVRATDAGGTLVQAAADAPQHGVRVAFVTDPEGHLMELVQFL